MKTTKSLTMIAMGIIAQLLFTGCTDLDEELYDIVTSENFIQTKQDLYRTFLRSYEHAYWTVQGSQYIMQENTGDQIMTPNREGDWFDGGIYIRAHNHTWTPQDWYCNDSWNNLYSGVVQATNSIEDIQAVDPDRIGITEAEKLQLIAELRVMRSWFYLRLFDFYRNIEIITAVKGVTEGSPQSTPEETFAFIEAELTESIPYLLSKGDPGTEGGSAGQPGNFDGRWTKAGAMSLLARLYINSEVYIGQSKYEECAALCENILEGSYGSYAIESRWDAPFDSGNNASSETIFAFPGTLGRSHWQYDGGMYFWMAPFNAPQYFGFTDFGGMNPRYSLQPGRDPQNVEYPFQLGKPFVKFQNYADDVRLKKYKNLGESTREGMFLYGYLPYNNNQDTVMTTKGYKLFIRDQVALFRDLPPGQIPENLTSNMNSADQNSGVYPVKYPFYPTSSTDRIESDYVEIRLAEIYYMLAECRFRAGQAGEAATLLNTVRSRYFPAGSESLYTAAEITEQELLDEWGREFVAEGRRRTDLIRFNKFSSGTWWDKTPDGSDHINIFPIGQNVLNVNPQLHQNPGY